MFNRVSPHTTLVLLDKIVMPRSISRSVESMARSPSNSSPPRRNSWSTRVVLPGNPPPFVCYYEFAPWAAKQHTTAPRTVVNVGNNGHVPQRPRGGHQRAILALYDFLRARAERPSLDVRQVAGECGVAALRHGLCVNQHSRHSLCAAKRRRAGLAKGRARRRRPHPRTLRQTCAYSAHANTERNEWEGKGDVGQLPWLHQRGRSVNLMAAAAAKSKLPSRTPLTHSLVSCSGCSHAFHSAARNGSARSPLVAHTPRPGFVLPHEQLTLSICRSVDGSMLHLQVVHMPAASCPGAAALPSKPLRVGPWKRRSAFILLRTAWGGVYSRTPPVIRSSRKLHRFTWLRLPSMARTR